MHMADALLSPAVGGATWAASASAIAYASRKVSRELDDRKVPLMGVLGAFLFAAQMINFSIPGTGSSGHLGGGLLLSVLLGPHAALLSIASVLVVQALFFADGGLLALGCNIFNMGVIPAFLVYPLVYRRLAGTNPGRGRLTFAIMISAVLSLQLGPLAVVLETWCSGVSSLPFTTFLLLMLPLHLAIGLVEGAVTATVLSFVCKARPELLNGAAAVCSLETGPFKRVALAFLAVALLTAGGLSWFASKNPDGLEWAIARVTGQENLKAPRGGVYDALARVQKRTAFLPDYSFARSEKRNAAAPDQKEGTAGDFGTSVAGLVGAGVTLAVVVLGGLILKRRKAA